MLVHSKIIPNARWEVRVQTVKPGTSFQSRLDIPVEERFVLDKEFLEQYNPTVYFNDLTAEHWCFDTKLPSGIWLENIHVRWDKQGNMVFHATKLVETELRCS